METRVITGEWLERESQERNRSFSTLLSLVLFRNRNSLSRVTRSRSQIS